MGRQKKPFPLGHFRLRYPKNYDKTKVYPVEIEYIFSGKPLRRSMNISVKVEDWNPNGNNGRGEIRASMPDSVRFNNLLLMKVNKVDAALNEYHQAHLGEVSEEIISAFLDDKPITRKDKGEDFITFVLKRLDSEYSHNKIGYSRYKNGQSCMNIFQQFLRATNNGTYKPDGLYIGEVTPELIDKYIEWRRDFKNNSDATINHALTPILKGCENACALDDNREQLRHLEDEVRKSKRRVKGLTTMIANLERQEVELNDEIARLESDIENGAGDVSELRRRIAELEKQLESTGQKLADKRDKLKTADQQLAELLDELDTLTEKRDDVQRDYSELTEKKQVQIRMRLTDAIFGRLVVDIRELFAAMPSDVKSDLDGEFLTAIAEHPNDILKCAMYLFLGYLDGATQFAQSCGGGGTSSDLPWGRNQDEDDRRFAYRCMMQAHKMLKLTQPKRGIGGR